MNNIFASLFLFCQGINFIEQKLSLLSSHKEDILHSEELNNYTIN